MHIQYMDDIYIPEGVATAFLHLFYKICHRSTVPFTYTSNMKACSGCSGLGYYRAGVQRHGSLTLYVGGMKRAVTSVI